MHGVSNRAEFAVALIRGLGGNLKETARENLAKEVFSWVGETPPSSGRLSAAYYNADRDRVDSYTSESDPRLSLSTFSDSGNLPLVKTSDVKATVDCLMSWLAAEEAPPFLVVGPEGCGKSLLLNHCFRKLRSTNIATVHCSAHISPQHVIQKLNQVIRDVQHFFNAVCCGINLSYFFI